MKYIVDVLKKMPSSATFNAWQKAPGDVIRTLENIGAKSAFILIPSYKLKPLSIIVGLLNTFRISLKIKWGDELYIQHYGYYINLLASIAKRRHAVLNYIVHDLTFLRFGHKNEGSEEISLLMKTDRIFVHTDNMAMVLRKYGIHAELKIMHLFDYYTNNPMISEDKMATLKNVVAFAGNLNKSIFLKKLAGSDIPKNIKYRLYGLQPDNNFPTNPQIEYMGAFEPSSTGKVQAGWGILWDGESIDTCSGVLGEYLKINSSHKLSLYLACGMPVILWKESSLAKWLSEQGVCVLVSSLKEVSTTISSLSMEDYMQMVKNARALGDKLRHGQMLKSLL